MMLTISHRLPEVVERLGATVPTLTPAMLEKYVD
jgi:hypothetical protein